MNFNILKLLIAAGLVGSPIMGFAVIDSQTQPVKQSNQTSSVSQSRNQNDQDDQDDEDDQDDQSDAVRNQDRKIPQPTSVDTSKGVQDTRAVDKQPSGAPNAFVKADKRC